MLHKLIAVGYIYTIMRERDAASVRKNESEVLRSGRGLGNLIGDINCVDLFAILLTSNDSAQSPGPTSINMESSVKKGLMDCICLSTVCLVSRGDVFRIICG